MIQPVHGGGGGGGRGPWGRRASGFDGLL